MVLFGEMVTKKVFDKFETMLRFWKKLGVVILVMVLSLASLVLGLWVYLGYDHIPSLIELSYDDGEVLEFDYIIVGAGTAGSVMAHHLSTYTNYTVLVIESGGIFSALSIMPLTSTLMQKTKEDWGFKTTRQKYSSLGLTNQQQMVPRGKGLGGSAQINYLLHFEGIETDFDNWVRLGATTWSYNNLKFWLHRHKPANFFKEPGFCKADGFLEDPLDYSSLILEELNQNLLASSSDTCSADQGQFNSSRIPTLKIKSVEPEKPLSKAAMETTAIFLAQHRPVGYKLAEFTIKNGVRWSAYHEFLRPASKKNKNLSILKATRVHKVLFGTSKRATHVLVSRESDMRKVTKISARQEIILSAGAIQTPQILKLSGVGPTEELEKFSIKTVHDSPKVGTNYFDHMSLPLFVSIDQSASVTKAKVLTIKALTDYLLYGSGVMGNPGVVGVGSAQNDTFGVILFGLGTVDEDLFRDIANYRKDTFRAVFPKFENSSQEGVIFLSSCHLPKSRGTVTLHSNRIEDTPEINPNYLAENYDVECMKRAIRFSVDTVESQPFVDLGAKIYWPKLKECVEVAPTRSELKTNRPSDEYLECFIRVAAITTYHPGGTCAIGSAADSALDDALNVRGVTGLRVVDASIFPAPVSGTPNSVLIAVAERAAHLVRQALK